VTSRSYEGFSVRLTADYCTDAETTADTRVVVLIAEKGA
jgi:hypothetical protein